jgi:probable HAF family extracellular repeat protein
VLLSLTALGYSGSARAAALYTITDLGPESLPTGITPNGQVFGTAAGQPLLYQNGQRVPIPGLSGNASVASYNDANQAVVNVVDPSNASIHAYIEQGGAVQDLGTLGGSSSVAAALNPTGVAVGAAQNGVGNYHAFVSSGGVMVDLGTLGGQASGATGVNAFGNVVGASATASGANHAFLFNGQKMIDLGTLGGQNSQATAINSAGLIVGSSMTSSGTTHAFLSVGGVMHDLGSLGDASYAYGINSSGQIIGMAYVPNSGSLLARATYSNGGPLIDLNSLIAPNSGWVLQSATGISDSGQIVGYGTFDGERRGFVLTPLVAVAAPEPTPFAMFALVVGAIAVRRRIRFR